MTTAQESVVTPQRFASGRTWSEYLEYIASDENQSRPAPSGKPRGDQTERVQRNIDQYEMKPAQAETLKSLPELKMLVLGEDWCPDVYRGLPVLAKICEVAGWEIRIFARDENNDIMSEFLQERDGDRFESIPTAVLYTPDHGYVTHWMERPQVANNHMAEMQKRFAKQEGESDDEMRQRMRETYQALQRSDDWDNWRHATVDEIIELVRANT